MRQPLGITIAIALSEYALALELEKTLNAAGVSDMELRIFSSAEEFLECRAAYASSVVLLFFDAAVAVQESLWARLLCQENVVFVVTLAPQALVSDAPLRQFQESFSGLTLWQPFTVEAVKSALEKARNAVASRYFIRTLETLLEETHSRLLAPPPLPKRSLRGLLCARRSKTSNALL